MVRCRYPGRLFSVKDIPIALGIVFASALTACVDKGGFETKSQCEAYLDCLAVTDEDGLESESERYGSNGTCFEEEDARACQQECRQRLDSVESSDPACEPPPPTPVDPDNAVGLVDCAAASPGPTVLGGEDALGLWSAWCSPRHSGQSSYACCSDDPSALMGELPGYQGLDGGTPIFSDGNNARSTSGLCVQVEDIPTGSGLSSAAAQGCPIPCNPTWSDADVATVCGEARSCCQTRAIEPEDCILDGDVWRPATGEDIFDNRTTWAPDRHATHQDPGGTGCSEVVGASDVNSPQFQDCVEQLTVANQRGFCLALSTGQNCPHEAPGYLDACEQINMGLIPPPSSG